MVIGYGLKVMDYRLWVIGCLRTASQKLKAKSLIDAAKVRHYFLRFRLNAKFCKVLQSSCKRARCKFTYKSLSECSRTKGAKPLKFCQVL